MEFYQVLILSHTGTSILLLALAITSVSVSVAIAVKPAQDPSNSGLLGLANVVGLMESIVAGFVALTGIAAMLMAEWPITELWLWMSILIMVFYLTTLKRVTKPARQVVSLGGSEIKTGMQVVLQTGHVLLLIVTYAMMLLKPA